MEISENIHINFQGKISDELYEFLNILYNFDLKADLTTSEKHLFEIFLTKSNNKLCKNDLFFKSQILYQRICTLIEVLFGEYKDFSPEDLIEVVDYYVLKNNLREFEFLGMGHLYYAKFKPKSEILFRSEKEIQGEIYQCKNPMIDFIDCKSNEEIIKKIFNLCREHINKGKEKIKLRSYSKSFGVVLFKYLSLIEEEKNVYLIIANNIPVNYIDVNKEKFSLQKFLMVKNSPDKVNFCIDMSNIRLNKKKELTAWMKNFLGDHSISLQSIVTPIADKEVIFSFKPEEDKYYRLSEKDLIYLVFKYYEILYKKNTNEDFNNHLMDMLEELKLNSVGNVEDEIYLEILNYLEDCIKNPTHDTEQKIKEILSFINWENELTDWKNNFKNSSIEEDFKKIYKNETTNRLISVFKLIQRNLLKGL